MGEASILVGLSVAFRLMSLRCMHIILDLKEQMVQGEQVLQYYIIINILKYLRLQNHG
jgi:hypothetical protein